MRREGREGHALMEAIWGYGPLGVHAESASLGPQRSSDAWFPVIVRVCRQVEGIGNNGRSAPGGDSEGVDETSDSENSISDMAVYAGLPARRARRF